MESLKAAVASGADAVYLGAKQYSARASAGNFTMEELSEAMDYCHLRGVKVYLTVNTLYKDNERQGLLQLVNSVYAMGVDALIVQDLGAAREIRAAFPELKLHASTQLTANTVSDVKALQQMGFSKVVLSRELNLAEIQTIAKQADVELETFIHGALCVSYSGQCIMSSMLGGRSGNRGRCAQTCRLPFSLYEGYEKRAEGHLMSTKDMETLEILPELMKSGISSFKIEGRMKTPEYVAGVTAIYRKYMDRYAQDPNGYAVEEQDKKVLLQLFNRGGFTEGYYYTHSGREMMSPQRPKSWGLLAGFVDQRDAKKQRLSIRTREPMAPGDGIEIWTKAEPHVGCQITKSSRAGEVIHLTLAGQIEKNDPVYKTYDKTLMDELDRQCKTDPARVVLSGAFTAKLGAPMRLEVWDEDGNTGFALGQEPEEAKNQPVTQQTVHRQLVKLGGTVYTPGEWTVTLEGALYIPIGLINQMRREALENLSKKRVEKGQRKGLQALPKARENNSQIRYEKDLTALVTTYSQFQAAVTHPNLRRIYVESNEEMEQQAEQVLAQAKRAGMDVVLALPRVWRSYTKKRYANLIELWHKEGNGFLARSVGSFQERKAAGDVVYADFSLNTFQSEAVNFWKAQGAAGVCLSPEMNLTEVNGAATAFCELLAYGHLPLMTTHQCPIGNYAGGKETGMYCDLRHHGQMWHLKDRKGEEFPLLTDCEICVCSILNGKPLFTLKFFEDILATPAGSLRLQFTIEDAARTDEILTAYEEVMEDWVRPGETARHLIRSLGGAQSTKGQYYRGVE